MGKLTYICNFIIYVSMILFVPLAVLAQGPPAGGPPGSLSDRVETLETDVGTLQTDVGTLQTDVGTLQTDVGTVQINAVYVNSDEQTVANTGFVTMDVSAQCDPGDIAVAGGYECRSQPIICQEAFHLLRSLSPAVGTWNVIAFFNRAANALESLVLQVRVTCLDITA